MYNDDREEKRQEAWDAYFQQRPHVLASWGHQNGRWPHYEDVPEWYDANPDYRPEEREAA